jgi:hypothetical protein
MAIPATAHSKSSPAFSEGGHPDRIPLTSFRMNTCKSVTKQTTLTPFRMNTYAKTGGGGYLLPPCSQPPQRAKSFASYHIPVTLAVSCDYALFGATAARQTFSHQEVTHSFHRNGGVPLTLLRKNKTPRVEFGDRSTPGRGQL